MATNDAREKAQRLTPERLREIRETHAVVDPIIRELLGHVEAQSLTYVPPDLKQDVGRVEVAISTIPHTSACIAAAGRCCCGVQDAIDSAVHLCDAATAAAWWGQERAGLQGQVESLTARVAELEAQRDVLDKSWRSANDVGQRNAKEALRLESELVTARQELDRQARAHRAEMRQAMEQVGQATRSYEAMQAERNAATAELEAEQAGRLEFRKRFGALESETFGAFVERLASEAARVPRLEARLKEARQERHVMEQDLAQRTRERDSEMKERWKCAEVRRALEAERERETSRADAAEASRNAAQRDAAEARAMLDKLSRKQRGGA